MKIQKTIKCLMPLVAFFLLTLEVQSKTMVHHLRCEYHENPIGIGVEQARLSWKLLSDVPHTLQTAYEIRTAISEKDLQKGKNLHWSSGKVDASISVNVEYQGPALQSGQRVYWQVRVWDNHQKVSAWSAPAFWESGLLKSRDWKASWITSPLDDSKSASRPAPYFRKDFSIQKKVVSARVYVSALGLYELNLNGQKVGNDLFTPGWTSYRKRVQYQTYDVTDLLQANNTIGAMLGDGWYRGNIGWSGNVNYYGDRLALIAQLVINYADGTAETIVTDENWKTAYGAIREADIYNGETYDARLEPVAWNKPGFVAENWENAVILDHPRDLLIASQGPTVRVISAIDPVKMLVTPEGDTLFDMGQNMVGWVQLTVNGNPGDRVVLRFAEVLDKNGNFYTANLRSAKATDTYILKGSGTEVYEPRFTFHGFRYVKVEGYPGELSLAAVKGMVVHSDMAPAGTFECSDPLINQLQQNIQWGQKGNFLDVPTDCPQRDERMGWTGDAQVFSPTAAFNYDVAAFFTKWMGDVAADQLPNGSVPFVVPDVLNGSGGSTAWADVAIIIPWNTYLAYGDERILEVQYPSMKAWVDFMQQRAGEDLIWKGDFHFGDWLAFASTRSDYTGATTVKDLIATAYFRHSSNLLSKIAAVLGNTSDAEKLALLSENIKNAFINEYVTPSGRLVSHTQTAYCLALAFDLLPTELVRPAAQFLADDVKEMGHLTTGFVGTPLLCKTLSDHGYDELAFQLLMRKEYPSWLYPVTQGATTIWERWDGQKPDGSFQDVGMNSFNHYAYGAIGEWLYTYVAGIQIDENNPGYQHFILSPHVGGGLSHASASYESVHGRIASGWELNDGWMTCHFEIPANTTATVYLPGIAESPDFGASPRALGELVIKDQTARFTLGSGVYSLRYKLIDY